jgi:hypothetical protein
MIPPLERGQLVTLKSTGLTYTAAGGRGEKTFEVLLKFTGLKLDSSTAPLDDIVPLDTDPSATFEPADDGTMQLMSGGPPLRLKPTDAQPPNGKVLYAWTKAGKEVVRPLWPETLRPYLRAPKTRKAATLFQVAADLARKLVNDARLELSIAVAMIEESYGFPHVFYNSNGNLTISDDVKKKFDTLCPEGTIWDEAKKEWRVEKVQQRAW